MLINARLMAQEGLSTVHAGTVNLPPWPNRPTHVFVVAPFLPPLYLPAVAGLPMAIAPREDWNLPASAPGPFEVFHRVFYIGL